MESLSIVATIVRIAQDITGAVATVRRNRSRCRKLAERVQGIGDLLRELHGSGAEAGAGTTDAATRRLLDRLEDALRRALELVRSCQDSSCPCNLLAGGRQAERFDEVDGEIDRCLLDLGSVANRILIARLEKLLLHQNVVRYRDPASTETVTLRIGPTPKKYDGGGDRKDTGVKDDGDKDDDSKTEKVAAPAESGAGAPSGAAAYYHHHHSPYPEVPPDMFSDENPNACTII